MNMIWGRKSKKSQIVYQKIIWKETIILLYLSKKAMILTLQIIDKLVISLDQSNK